ncbi:MAG: alpha/beta fold hydrolase, partial [Flavisolibacter sp.]
MRILWCIGLLLLWKHSFSQDTCRPKYDLKVQYLSVDSLRIAYVEKGNGQPVIFIHGLGGNSSHWLKSIHQLSNKFKCIAIDLPGYGYSEKNIFLNGKDQLQFFTDRIISFIKKRKLKKVVLVGHSMGGQIAMIAAIQY